ncbi:MAG: gamma-glutamyl-gamma-aminobutyrate hydrolase family protein [Oligoflexales bacterium]|nr:gamma-glutamyl-gamma-aminobutyrate hydrolase family protein [Oligoflexales bacterium]
MNIDLIDCGSQRVPEIRSALDFLGCKVDLLSLEQQNLRLNFPNPLVISGGPRLFTEAGGEDLARHFDFLERVQTPILGICLGLQGIAKKFGGSVFRGVEVRTARKLNYHKEHPLFEKCPADTLWLEDHCEGVTLPENFDCLASSLEYPIEAMVHRQRAIFGVQFHPESSGASGRLFFANFLNIAQKQLKLDLTKS